MGSTSSGCCQTRDKDEAECDSPPPMIPTETSKNRLGRFLSSFTAGGGRSATLDQWLKTDLATKENSDSHFSHHFSTNNQGRIDDSYIIEDNLGEGSHGVVRRGTCRSTSQQRAIKSICFSKLKGQQSDMLLREIGIMKLMDHPHIVKLYETFKDAKFYYFVMELCTGGEFFDRIVRDATHGFEEEMAANYMRQILSAVSYVHKRKVVHRDIKPENFLLQDPSKTAHLKMIDFGVAALLTTPGDLLKTRCGTGTYVAPEVLAGRYGQSCDVWSCGVICFILLCGASPWSGNSQQAIMKEVRKAQIVFRESEWRDVSDSAKQLVQRMLLKDVDRRPTAQELLKNNWLQSLEDQKVKRKGKRIHTGMLKNFQSFNKARRLKKMTITMIATMLDDKDIKELRDAFTALDTNGDGTLSKEEILAGLQDKITSKALSQEELQHIMEARCMCIIC